MEFLEELVEPQVVALLYAVVVVEKLEAPQIVLEGEVPVDTLF